MSAAVERFELVWLVVAAVLNSLVSVYYYLRVVTAMRAEGRGECYRTAGKT
jgi:NADH:ubiquinone oxidoreductase subunit 2 (subunit N)